MSELTRSTYGHDNFRRQLLSTASAFVLMASVCAARAADSDSDAPPLWIELGGQLEGAAGSSDAFLPPFATTTPRPAFETISPASVQRSPGYSTGEEGAITFEPEGTNWVFSASIRYGRSSGNKVAHQQTYPAKFYITAGGQPFHITQKVAKFSDFTAKIDETHLLLDFKVGKDLGIGMFGTHGQSVISLGVRVAQFNARSNVSLKSHPDAHSITKYSTLLHEPIPQGTLYHSNIASAAATRNFRGIGPSLAWNASAPVAGTTQNGEITFDWGANAAVLFGRQKANGVHQTSAFYHPGIKKYGTNHKEMLYQTGASHARVRSVVVPNVGGFAGLSFRYAAAKLSLGYRGDFFFGAIDGGIDAAKKENVGFYGPFASVSIGIGG